MLGIRLSFLALALVIASQPATALTTAELSAIRELRGRGQLAGHRFGSRFALRRRQAVVAGPSVVPLAGTDVVTQPNNECKPTSDGSTLLNAENAQIRTQLPPDQGGEQYYIRCTVHTAVSAHLADARSLPTAQTATMTSTALRTRVRRR